MEFKQRASVAHTDHSSHPSEPVIDQSRLPDTSPRNDGHDVYVLVCPSFRSRNRRASTIEALLLLCEQLASFSEDHIRLRRALSQ